MLLKIYEVREKGVISRKFKISYKYTIIIWKEKKNNKNREEILYNVFVIVIRYKSNFNLSLKYKVIIWGNIYRWFRFFVIFFFCVVFNLW